jgi:hypothetical protein
MTESLRKETAMRTSSTRLRVEVIIAALAAGLGVLTLFWRDWIEAFGIDPDNGSGAAEWYLVGGLFAVAAVLAVVARYEWRRANSW